MTETNPIIGHLSTWYLQAQSDFWRVFLTGWPTANFTQKNEVMLKFYRPWTKEFDMRLEIKPIFHYNRVKPALKNSGKILPRKTRFKWECGSFLGPPGLASGDLWQSQFCHFIPAYPGAHRSSFLDLALYFSKWVREDNWLQMMYCLAQTVI